VVSSDVKYDRQVKRIVALAFAALLLGCAAVPAATAARAGDGAQVAQADATSKPLCPSTDTCKRADAG